jgi:hypothetical protein
MGFCCDEINPFGPVQEYVAPIIPVAPKDRVVPEHTDPLLLAVILFIGIGALVALVSH